MKPSPRLGETLDALIYGRVQRLLQNHKAGIPLPEEVDFFTDNLGEVFEKLMIEHIRAWMTEDAIGEAMRQGDDVAVVALKKKLETCWKIRRPRLVAALNKMIDDALVHNKSLFEDSVKIYKGYE